MLADANMDEEKESQIFNCWFWGVMAATSILYVCTEVCVDVELEPGVVET